LFFILKETIATKVAKTAMNTTVRPKIAISSPIWRPSKRIEK